MPTLFIINMWRKEKRRLNELGGNVITPHFSYAGEDQRRKHYISLVEKCEFSKQLLSW